jgi:pSer/pThr/pTyr-binding forkhead associated (FHA) protein
MSELTITLLRLGYLALLWVFVLAAIGVLRKDIYGTRITPRLAGRSTGTPAPSSPGRSTRPTRLVVTDGGLTGTTLPLTSSAILIGRAPACTLVLDDDYSSSRHARIFPQGEQWVVEDLGSTNGTYIGEQRLAEPTILPAGTPVRIGQTVLELQR